MRRIILAGFTETFEGVCVSADHQRRQKMRHSKLAIVVMAMCTFGLAQDKTADKKPAAHEHGKATTAGMPMPQPAPEIQKMYSMEGSWAATIKTEPGPW